MNRRELLQTISILSGAAMLSPKYLFANQSNKLFRVMGIGDVVAVCYNVLLVKGLNQTIQ